MPYKAKLPPGGLRAAVEQNLRDKQQRQDLKLEGPEMIHDPKPGARDVPGERFKLVKVDQQDYEGANQTAANCAVARAIRRALAKPPEVTIDVWVDKVRIGENCYALPAEVTEADRLWCQSGIVTILEFQLSNRKVTP